MPDISREPLFLNKTRSRRIEKDRISFLGVPIKLQATPIGVLSVDRLFGDEVSFEEDIRFLSIVATLVAQFVSINRQVKAREESLRKENISLRAELSERYGHFFMVAKSRSMAGVQEMIKKVAPSKASVLLLGESGTGKTLIARIIHELSNRAKLPFVKVNCTSLPETCWNPSSLAMKKALSGASRVKIGRIEEVRWVERFSWTKSVSSAPPG